MAKGNWLIPTNTRGNAGWTLLYTLNAYGLNVQGWQINEVGQLWLTPSQYAVANQNDLLP